VQTLPRRVRARDHDRGSPGAREEVSDELAEAHARRGGLADGHQRDSDGARHCGRCGAHLPISRDADNAAMAVSAIQVDSANDGV
jgi:hypothetical protein